MSDKYTISFSWFEPAPTVEFRVDEDSGEWVQCEKRRVPMGRVEVHDTFNDALTAKHWHERHPEAWLPAGATDPVVSEINHHKDLRERAA